MKNSLSTRLMYSFMVIIVIVVVGITAGISYLIADYFFEIKEQELTDKGHEMGETIEAFIRMDDKNMLYRYIIAVDRLVGARIWLFDDNYELIAASYYDGPEKADEPDSLKQFMKYGVPTASELKNNAMKLDKDIKESSISYRIKIILHDIYAGKSFKSQIFHPHYKEQVILVGVPYKTPNGKTGAILMIEPLSGFEKFLRNVYIYITVVGIIALFVSLFLVKTLSRKIIKPVQEMKDSAVAMASGDYTRRLVVQGQDEIAELASSLNSLGSDLSAYIAKMERTDKIRRDFVANVSHELRTPITIIRGYNEAISDGMVTDPEVLQRYRTLINEETVRLERMVRELLDISRLETSDPLDTNSMDELPLAVIIRNVAEKLSVKAVKRKVIFNVHADENIKILGDGDQMVQLILILGDNALKYSPENGTVSIGAKKLDDGSVLLSVSDQGKGIPEADIPFIWERFYKVEKSHCRSVPGTGLGLAIAKEIIRVHGASARVISKCGLGTTFEIKFPKDKVV